MRTVIAFAFALLLFSNAASAAQSLPLDFAFELDVPEQSVQSSLQELTLNSQYKLLCRSELVQGKSAPALKGEFTTEQAVRTLLGGTSLTYEITPSAAGVIKNRAGLRLAQAETATATSGASAQDEDEPERARLEEVIVTATKRGAERLQDIPMSIAVLSSQELERRGVIGMEDYLRSIPGVNEIDNGPSSNAIVIRGISTYPEFENLVGGTTVATYFDETAITGAGGLGAGGIDVRPVDIERIEVLRGPQGTAYGAASLGGTMRIIPAKPKLDAFGANVAASYSQTAGFGSDNSMYQAMVNIPLIADRLALRVVGYEFDESGYYRNIAGTDADTIADAEEYGLGDFVRGYTQNNVGRVYSRGGRLAALWHATDKLNLTFNFLTQKIEQDGMPFATDGRFLQTQFPISPQGRVRGEEGEIGDTEADLFSLVFDYDLGWASLTSVASWVDGGSVWANSSAIPYSLTGPSDSKFMTAEARVASRLRGRFQFLAGLYYEDTDEELHYSLDWAGPLSSNPAGTDPMLFIASTNFVEQRAVFGEVSYEVTSKLKTTVGGRFFKYERHGTELTEGGWAGVPNGTGVPTGLSSGESRESFKANLSYEPMTNAMLYASWAEGFRLGRPAVGLPAGVCDTNGDGMLDGTEVSIASTRQINSDFLESYELGGKLTLLDRRVVLDAAVYHIKWDGLPVFAEADCGDEVPRGYIANGGAATSDGFEFQAKFHASKGVTFDVGGSYIKAELSKDVPPQGWNDGDRLPGSPKLSLNFAGQYDFDFAGHKAYVRADAFYAGEFFGDLALTPGLKAGDYIKADARAGIALSNVNVELFVRNLTNEDAFTYRGAVGGSNGHFGYRLRPRTVGIQVGYRFQ